MSDRPIIFSAPMVRALLDGRKTQTRRLLRPQPTAKLLRFQHVGTDKATGRAVWEAHDWSGPVNAFPAGKDCVTCSTFTPAVGDRLWVRESICQSMSGMTLPSGEYESYWTAQLAEYVADGAKPRTLVPGQYNSPWTVRRPSIHMPRWASRLTLTVTDVRLQKLWQISADDCLAEGIPPITDTESWSAPIPKEPNLPAIYGGAFCKLWNDIHGWGAWDANPFVVALTFTVDRRNIDQGAST